MTESLRQTSASYSSGGSLWDREDAALAGTAYSTPLCLGVQQLAQTPSLVMPAHPLPPQQNLHHRTGTKTSGRLLEETCPVAEVKFHDTGQSLS